MPNAQQAASGNELDLARQWIAFLQRRNTILSLVWPLLLVAAIGFAALSLFLYQDLQLKQTESELGGEDRRELLSKIDVLTQQRNEVERKRKLLAEQMQTLKSELQSEQGLISEQNQLNADLVATLKRRIKALEEEGRGLEDLLSQKQEEVQTLTLQNKKIGTQLTNLQQQDSLLRGKLQASQTAFDALSARQRETRAEVDRLANLLIAKEQEVAKGIKQYRSLEQVVQKKDEEIQLIQNKVAKLEQRLEALLSPISLAPTPVPAMPLESRQTFEPKTATPVEKDTAQATTATTFDYDSIAIDRP